MNKINGILCLNLPQSQDRRRNITQEFQKHEMISKVNWIKAVNVSTLNLKTIKYDQKVGPRCYCQGLLVSKSHNNHRVLGLLVSKRPNNQRFLARCSHRYRKLRPVEIAIALSHRLAYQQIITDDLDLALVCEDDVVFHANFNQILADLLTDSVISELLSLQPYLIFLGGRSDNPGLKKTGQKIKSSQTGSYSNYGYLINHAGAECLLKTFFPIQRPEDSYKRFLIGAGKIKCYQVSPSLIGELSAGTNLPKQYHRLSR